MLVSQKTTPQRTPSYKARSVHKQRGFTLIEVMIASFVLAVGMLGSTAMVLRGMQTAEITNHDAVAVQLAMNMAERMRGNIKEVRAGAYNGLAADSAGAVDCSSLCSSADVVLYHAYIWGTELEDLLPNTNPSASVTAINPGVLDSPFRISISWDSNKRTGTDTSANQTNTYVMIFQP